MVALLKLLNLCNRIVPSLRLTGIGVMAGAGLNICTVEGLDIGSIDEIVGCQKSWP